MRVVDTPDRIDEPRAEKQSPEHRLAPDIEVAVLEPQALLHRRIRLVDVERRRLGFGEDLELARPELDIAGRQPRVLRTREPARDGPGDGDHILVPEHARGLERRRSVLAVEHDLGDAVAVAQVDEDEAAVIAPAVDPSGEPRGRAVVGRSELAAGVRAIGRGEAGVLVDHLPVIVGDAAGLGHVLEGPRDRPGRRRGAQRHIRPTRGAGPAGVRGRPRPLLLSRLPAKQRREILDRDWLL